MIFLIILASLAAIILFLLLCPFGIRLKYSEGTLVLKLLIGPIAVGLLPERKKSLKKILRQQKKDDKKNAEKATHENANKDKKSRKKSALSSFFKESAGIRDTVTAILDIVKHAAEKFKKGFKIKIYRFELTVCQGNAAATAILCGAVSQSLAYLYETLSLNCRFTPPPAGKTAVIPDFSSNESEWTANIELKGTVNLLTVASSAVSAYMTYGKYKEKFSKNKALKNTSINGKESTK